MFGIAQTVVNPPWAAAASPLATVSASSLPGSRRWAWRSMKPGATTTPSGPTPSASAPDSQVTLARGPVLDDDLAGSLATRRRVDQPRPADRRGRAPDRSRGPRRRCVPASRYSSAIRTATPLVTWSVITDWAPAATSAAISTPSFIGPGCMTRAPGRASARRSRGQPVAGRVFAQRRQQPGRHPLALDPQRHDDVGVAQRLVDRGRDVEAPAGRRSPAGPRLEAAEQRRRAAQPQVGAGRGQRPDVGARHARMEQVAEDHDLAARPATRRAGARASCTGRAGPGSGGRASRRRR